MPCESHQFDQLLAYRDLLVEWNANRMNLTRLTSPRDIAIEHFLDSVSLLRAVEIPANGTLIDIGAGAGFPSLPIKIMRPDIKVTLLESTAKKLDFCKAVVDLLGLKEVRLIHGRAEETRPELRRRYDVVTARAVAPLSKLIPWCEPYRKTPMGVIAALKGMRAPVEIMDAKDVLASLKLKAQIKLVDVYGSEKAHAVVVIRSVNC